MVMSRHGNKDAAKYRARYRKAIEELEAVNHVYEASRRRAVKRRLYLHRDERTEMYVRDFMKQLDLRKVFRGNEVDHNALKAEAAAYNKEWGGNVEVSEFLDNCYLYIDTPIED